MCDNRPSYRPPTAPLGRLLSLPHHHTSDPHHVFTSKAGRHPRATYLRPTSGRTIRSTLYGTLYTYYVIPACSRQLQRHLLINVVVKISDADAISTIFTWHQVKASTPRLPYMQYTVIDAPRRQNVEFYGPSDPFDRPMFLFVSHRTLNGTPVRTFTLPPPYT